MSILPFCKTIFTRFLNHVLTLARLWFRSSVLLPTIVLIVGFHFRPCPAQQGALTVRQGKKGGDQNPFSGISMRALMRTVTSSFKLDIEIAIYK